MRQNVLCRSANGRGVVVVVAAALFSGCASPLGPDPSAPALPAPGQFRSELVEEVTADGALVHVEALQRIADANGGNRASPGPGYDASVDWSRNWPPPAS